MSAKNVASALTLSRLPIGLVTAWLLFRGSFTAAFVVFLAGQLTDILDGVIARRFKCESTWGAEWDRRMDMALHLLTTAGYVAGALFVWGDWKIALAPFATLAWIFVVTLPFFQRHSAASKLRSGVIRFVLLGFMIVRLPDTTLNYALVLATVICSIPVVIHEIKQTIKEVATGKRRWFKSPIPWRDDQLIEKAQTRGEHIVCAEDSVTARDICRLYICHVRTAAGHKGFMASVRNTWNDARYNGSIHFGVEPEDLNEAKREGMRLLTSVVSKLDSPLEASSA